MNRWMLAACAACTLWGTGASAQTATSSATMNTQAGTSSASTAPPVQARPSEPSRPSRPMGAAYAGEAAPEGTTVPLSDSSRSPNAEPVDTGWSIGGSGSAGLAAMGGGVDAGAAPPTSTMGAGSNLMTECPLGFVRYLGLCVTHAQAKQAQRPNKAPVARKP